MKPKITFFLGFFSPLFLFLLAACTATQIPPTAIAPILPTRTIPVQLAPSGTPSPLASPIGSPEATATTTPADGRPSSPCLFLIEAKTLDSDQLQVVYASDCVSEFDATPKKLWLWVEGQQPAKAFPLLEDVVEPYLSNDHEWILFRRDMDEQVKEIWAVGGDGQHGRKLATVALAEVEARYPGSVRVVLEYSWVGASNRMVYRVYPQYDLEVGAYDALVLVDVETGASYPLAPAGDATAVAYAADGSQIAVSTPDELHLIDARSGELQFTLPLTTGMASPGMLQYSPSGRHLVVFALEGIAIVDATQGTFQILPVEFVLWGAGDSPPAKPAIYWAIDDTFFMATLHSEIIELFEGNIEIWQVDAAKATATVLQRFAGFYPSVILAPNSGLRHLLYQKTQPGNPALRELYLLDLTTGEQRLYAEGALGLISWSPDSSHFLFTRLEPLEGTENFTDRYYLGHVELEPMLLGESLGFLRWADDERFLTMRRTADSVEELRLFTLDGKSVLIGSSEPEGWGIK